MRFFINMCDFAGTHFTGDFALTCVALLDLLCWDFALICVALHCFGLTGSVVTFSNKTPDLLQARF